ncbi:tetratricopeptide repeat protein 39B-like isoform X1 [Pygocentrus nattereri]|uniref:tetratricopeptide repeat protein 39B-like isoform X1 n=1 Tax=Pygocentrus nattereri TaxID=42514 RepID=UPI000814405C|nr:tetratricopeptide repeat protein 39B-like isoform X1 [Pygocentrus nattereri]
MARADSGGLDVTEVNPCKVKEEGRSAVHTEENGFEDSLDHSTEKGQMDLKTALNECSVALSLFLNNKFSEALDVLRPWREESVYHAMGYSSILAMQAGMTFDPKDMQSAIVALRDALNTCQRMRKRSTVLEAISYMVYKHEPRQLTEEEMHAELCYAELLLQRAVLTFVEDESMIGFLKAGLKMRTSYLIFKECESMLDQAKDKDTHIHFVGGVNMGIGSFNLMLSLFPARVLRLLEFVGFSGNREVGLNHLHHGVATTSLRSILSTFTLLMFNIYITVILGTGECNLAEADALLEPYAQKFPTGALMLFYAARIAVLKGDFETAQRKFLECIAVQQEWRQIHHLCYWELMWIHSFQQDWLEAYRYADLLCKESKWSQAVYVFQKASILSMLTAEEVKKTGEDVVELFRQVESLRLRFAGKSVPTEKFAARKARRYSSPNPIKLIVPALEMMYVWNGFTIVGKRPELTQNLLVTIEKAEEDLRNAGNPSVYHADDQSLIQMLKGLCLRHLGRLEQAEHCFNYVISSEKSISYDHYLVPFTMCELGLLYKQQGAVEKAVIHLEKAKLNYKNYSMESRLHFRIHAALTSLADEEKVAQKHSMTA